MLHLLLCQLRNVGLGDVVRDCLVYLKLQMIVTSTKISDGGDEGNYQSIYSKEGFCHAR